ncbi:MAG: hypothetical protein IK121_05640 [Lachnospiraceae bacterium]|nr:hypothetical protein [Lachnospiraceae bacterium]
MKKDLRSSKQIIKALSIGISATMLLQPISAFADEGTVNAAGNLHTTPESNRDQAITDATVAAEVKAAEDADKAAYEAKEAAEKALELADALLEKAEGKEATGTEEAVDGILDKDNNKDGLTLEENVEEAKEAVADANEAVDDLQTEVDAALDVIAEEATNDVSANVTATETAYDNADKAEDAARLALETLSGNDSIVYKEDAMVEVNKAIEAANTADQEAKKAETALTEAQERYNKAVEDYEALLAQADVSRNEIEKSVSDNEYAAAQDELAKAKEAMEAAKAEYDEALANVGTAEANAQTALEKAGIADENADKVIDYLEMVKKSKDLAILQQQVTNAENILASAEENQKKVDTAQDAIIEAREAEKKAAETLSQQYAGEMSTEYAEVTKQQGIMNQADNTIKAWTKQSQGGVKGVDSYDIYWGWPISKWEKDVAKWRYDSWLGDKRINYEYYTDEDVKYAEGQIANATKAYKDAEVLRDAANTRYNTAKDNKDAQDKIASTAQSGIETAKSLKKNAEDGVTSAKTDLAKAKTELSFLTDYIYTEDPENTREIDFNDKNDQELIKSLLKDVEKDYAQYNEVREDYWEYHDLVSSTYGFLDIVRLKWLFDWWSEKNIEEKYRDWDWHVEQGGETHVILTSDKDNEKYLLKTKNGKFLITQISEAEFATYSATFDAVAAAQAAKKAADAAEAEKEALKKYNAAVARLSTLQDEVDALQVKALTNDAVVDELDAAYRRLASAFAMVNQASQNYNDAKEEAKKAKDAADEAQKIADSKASRPTPAPSDDDDDDYVVPTSEETTPAPIQTVVLPQGGVTVAQTPVTVVDEATPQAAAPVTIKEEAAPKAAAPEVAEAKEVIPEEEVPLAAADQSKMNWWWLLVVLVLGTTGAELYRRHMIKKNADSAKTTK